MTITTRTRHPAYIALAKSWKRSRFLNPPFFNADDQKALSKAGEKYLCTYGGYQEFIESQDFGRKNDKRFHLGLYPVPFSGNIASADVFILMLNPGFIYLDYFAQESSRNFRKHSLDKLRFTMPKGPFPLHSMNPEFAWMSGSEYWRGKFDSIVRLMMERRAKTYTDALSILAKRIAILQLYPYHSTSFHLPRSVASQLKSPKLMIDFVQQVLLPEARSGQLLLIVARKARRWGLKQSKNIVVYTGSEARSASFSKRSRGGKAITRHLGLS
jgi:hypothetical protein